MEFFKALQWKAILIAILVGFSGGVWFKAKLVAADKAEELAGGIEAQKTAQATADTAAGAWEKQLEFDRAVTREVERRMEDEVKSNPVYDSCSVPASGVRALADAVSGKSSRELGKPVP